MLKGVSQKVIEVVHTDNRYFEKAILFLRPNAQGEDKLSLRARAGEYLSQIDYNPAGHEKCKTPLGEALKIGLAAWGPRLRARSSCCDLFRQKSSLFLQNRNESLASGILLCYNILCIKQNV